MLRATSSKPSPVERPSGRFSGFKGYRHASLAHHNACKDIEAA